jgi:hypothetical protein
MTLIQAIMSRDGCSYEEAVDLIEDMAEQVNDGEDPEDVLFDEGFEPDYITDLLEYL